MTPAGNYVPSKVLCGSVIDYSGLLRNYAGRFDFYDSRTHLGSLPAADLAAGVGRRAAALAARGVRAGDRVVMVASNDERYLSTLLAVLTLGAVPCAVAAPPAPNRKDSAGVRHLRAAVRVVDPAVVIGTPAVSGALEHPGLVEFDDLTTGAAFDGPARPPARPEDIHHIQLTSGSTSAPKAVLLTHANVAHNLGVLAHGIDADVRHDRIFSWLPLYHDMGLIQILGGLVYGVPVGLMSPLGFLRDPLSWVRHMTGHGSTVTAGPTFAYRAVTDALGRSAGRAVDIDLSALRHAFVGAEPISYAVLRRFTASFGPHGLRDDALVPCYGMAESVLATTLALRSAPAGPRNFGRVRVVETEGRHAPLVSCGPPVDGMTVTVVDRAGAETGPGMVGDIRIHGASVMAGYLKPGRRPGVAVQSPSEGWHDTGDRGFLCGGELFVVGRSKEMLIVRGRNLAPYDVEQEIGEMAGVGPGNAVVFSAPDDSGTERVVAVLATAIRDAAGRNRLRTEVGTRVREVFGVSLHEVVAVPRGAIPRTTSGKIRRLAVRELHRSGHWSVFATGAAEQVSQPAHIEQHDSEPTAQD